MPGYFDPTYGRQAAQDIQGAQAAGFFNPMGSPAIMAATRRNALRNADNARRRAGILSRLMGLDPNQARVAQVNADTEASGATQGALNDAQLQQLMGNQQYYRGLFGSQLGNENQMGLMRYEHGLNQPTIGGALGGLAGQGAGAFLGGWGASLGQGMGQRRQRQRIQPQYYQPSQYYGPQQDQPLYG